MPTKTFLAKIFALFGKSATAQLHRDTPQGQGISPERLRKLDKRYEAGGAAGEVPGALVLIARNGKIVYERAFGFADKPGAVAMTYETVFARSLP